MKKWSKKQNAFALALAWTAGTVFCVLDLIRWYCITDRLDGRILVLLVLSAIDAVLWWMRCAKMRKETANEEKETS